ncbi:MAG: L,D-transpeptidase [Clostridiales bacterium]|jgi:hypothetical protein|nr:L,D-transpeptidase [Clostridiales bacterium]
MFHKKSVFIAATAFALAAVLLAAAPVGVFAAPDLAALAEPDSTAAAQTEAQARAAAGTGYADGYAELTASGELAARAPDTSFVYRYEDTIAERRATEERLRLEAEEAARLAAEAKRLSEMRANAARLTEAELNELFSQDYFIQRMRDLGFYKDEFGDDSLNYRNAVIRLQSSINMPIDASLGIVSKKALLENSPVVVMDEIAEPASADGYWITINKSKNILTVYKGAQVHKKYPVATGASASLTPEGKFSFVSKAVNPAWGGGGYASPVPGGVPSNPLGKRWMGLSIGGGGRYGVHGNASSRSIGTYASHGCVRMINPDVEEMFEYIPVGTPVWIGSDSKLKEFGILQYYTVPAPTEAAPAPTPEPEAAPTPAPRDPERAELITPPAAELLQ